MMDSEMVVGDGDEPLGFNEFIEKYKYKKATDIIAYELYLIIKHLENIDGE